MGNAVGTIGKVVKALSPKKYEDLNQRVLAGVLKQLYGIDEEGNASFLGGLDMKPNPGLVDEVLAMGTLLPERYTPDVSKASQEDIDKLNELINEQLGLEEAHGYKERGEEALGTMLSQGPVGVTREAVTKAPGMLRKMGRGLGTAAEWFTPTVEAKPLNYAVGALTGGGLGGLADQLSDLERSQELTRGMKALDKGMAEGGKVSGLRMLLKLAEKKGFDPDLVKEHMDAFTGGHPDDMDEFAQSLMGRDLEGNLHSLINGEFSDMPMGDGPGIVPERFQELTGLDMGPDSPHRVSGIEDALSRIGRDPLEEEQSIVATRGDILGKTRQAAEAMAAKVAATKYLYKAGDRIRGSKPHPYEVLHPTLIKDKPAYRVWDPHDEQEFDMPESGVTGLFDGPKKFGKGGSVEKLMAAIQSLKAEMPERKQTEIYKSLSDLSDQHEMPVSQIMHLLERQNPPMRTPPIQAQVHPDPVGQLPWMTRAMKLRNLTDEPFDYLNTNLEIPFQTRQDLATAYAKAIGAYHDVMDQPSEEALGLYEKLHNEFGQMAAPFKPQE